jgi:hypothetical protein
MPVDSAQKHYCERCGAELLPADPAPLCTSCWVSDSSVYAPSLLITNDMTWNGTTPSRQAAPAKKHEYLFGIGLEYADPDGEPQRRARRRKRRLTLAFACMTALALMLAVVPAAISDTTPGPVHLGIQRTDKGTDACLANLYILMADKVAGRASPSSIVCPVTGKPYVYTQYQGVTTIECPDASAHNVTRIYIRTDTKVPVVN